MMIQLGRTLFLGLLATACMHKGTASRSLTAESGQTEPSVTNSSLVEATKVALATDGSRLQLHCTPFTMAENKAQASGILRVTGRDSQRTTLDGDISFSTYDETKTEIKGSEAIKGFMFLRQGTVGQEFYQFSGKFSGASQFTGASIGLRVEDGATSFSAIYNKDGWRFEMDCSKSRWL